MHQPSFQLHGEVHKNTKTNLLLAFQAVNPRNALLVVNQSLTIGQRELTVDT
jgi:hypothetical protein